MIPVVNDARAKSAKLYDGFMVANSQLQERETENEALIKRNEDWSASRQDLYSTHNKLNSLSTS